VHRWKHPEHTSILSGDNVVVADYSKNMDNTKMRAVAVLVRYAFRGRLTILRGLLGLQSIPGTLMLLPVFVLFSSAGTYLGVQIIGTRWGLFIAYLTFALPFSTWVMVTYLRGLPRELEEAARIDGASNLQCCSRSFFRSACRPSSCLGSSPSCWVGTTSCSPRSSPDRTPGRPQ
jgi:hypothetical protein